MMKLATFTRIVCSGGLMVVLASACGGRGFSSDDGGGGGDGGTSTGGTGPQAGKNTGGSSRAGTSAGGSMNAGSSSGGSGTAGSPATDLCHLPPAQDPNAPGGCAAYFPRWYHEPSTGLCTPIIYGGCGATANNFETLEACQQACQGGTPNYDSCQQASDCMVAGPGCCGICDGPGITAHDLIAYNRQFAPALQCGVAFNIALPPGGVPNPGRPAPIVCEPCQAPEPGQGSLHFFIPTCTQGQCGIEDLRTSEATACQTTQDCRLRRGSGCCESCDASNLIAVRFGASFEKLVCGNLLVDCAACEPMLPPDASAVCVAGHCQVAYGAGAAN